MKLARIGLLWTSFMASTACAGQVVERTYSPAEASAPRTVVAEPGTYQEVYVDDTYVYEGQASPDQPTVGYETLSSGDRVEVVYYVHTYSDPIDTYPSVYWSGRWYYNVNGDFVFWSPAYQRWCYYWGPPAPLVTYWNSYYPWSPYSWGVGFYGAGWYWGGVGMYGYHAYGLPVNDYHHHHHSTWQGNGGRDQRPTVHHGQPTTGPAHAGGPVGAGRRAARRVDDGRPAVAQGAGRRPVDGAGRGDRPAASPAPGYVAGTVPAGAGRRTDPAVRQAPSRTLAGAQPAPVRTRTVTPGAGRRVPGGDGHAFTTAGGQRVRTVEAGAGRAAPTRRAVTLGQVEQGRASPPPARVPDGSAQWAPVHAPSRARPEGGGRPDAWGSGPARVSRPLDAAPSRAAPSRSYSPPSRSHAPAAAAPSRSYSPPSRSYSPPSRSAPSRSFSAPSRSFSPARSAPPMRGGGGGHGGGAGRRPH